MRAVITLCRVPEAAAGPFVFHDELDAGFRKAADIGFDAVELFLPGPDGRRPAMSGHPVFSKDPHWRGLVQFHEYFHAETGRGCGANHQTGWTALVIRHLEDLARMRAR